MMYEPLHHDDLDIDPYANTQLEQTQQASQLQTGTEPWDDTLWGVLKPLHHSLNRIELKKEKSSVSVGRAHENDVQLKNLKISNKHCVLTWNGSQHSDTSVIVHDKSSNGTWINGIKIGRGRSAMLKDGNEIAFGPYSEINSSDNHRYIFRFMADGPPQDGVHKYYDIGPEIGRGSFATVYRAVGRTDGRMYAVKMINRNRIRSNATGSTNVFMKEIDILSKLHHKNICQLVDTFQEPEDVVLVLEYVDGGDLLDYILQRAGLSEDEARWLAFQLCKALKYIHARDIAHRDLKPENILMTRDDPPVLKIADFGLAKAVDSATRFKTMCGTPVYLAPEVILRDSQETYNRLVDSWSAGVIIFAMIANTQPFLDDEASIIHVRFRSRYIDWSLVETKNISLDCREFLERLLEENPAERMSCADALKHSWLAPLSKNDLEALDDTPNNSFLSHVANAGSFTEVPTSQVDTHEPVLNATPESQELRSTGVSGDFEQIRMHEATPVSATTASSQPEPTPESGADVASTSRGQVRKLERHRMQIAEYDDNGNLVSFRAFPDSPPNPGPIFVDSVNGNTTSPDSGPEDRLVSSSNGNDDSEDAKHSDRNDKGNDGPTPALTPVADVGNAITAPTTSNARKRSAPASPELRDASMSEEAPTKRTRAVPADVAP